MRRVHWVPLCVLAVGLVGSSVPAKAAAPPPREVNASAWSTFSSPEGKFSVRMPGKPTKQSQEVATEVGKVTFTIFSVSNNFEGTGFAVSYNDYPPNPEYSNEAGAHKVLSRCLGGVMRTRKAVVQKRSKLRFGKYHGQQVEADLAAGEVKSLGRVFLVGNRLYQMYADWPAEVETGKADAEKFLNSFKLTGSSETARILPPTREEKQGGKWTKFAPPEGKFSIEMPGKPVKAVHEVPTAAGKVKVTFYTVEDDVEAVVFLVGFSHLPDGVEHGDEESDHAILERSLGSMVRACKGKVQKRSKIKIGDSYGQECVVTRPAETKSIFRVYLVGDRLYQLQTHWPVARKTGQAEAEKFLNSFKLKK